MTTNLGTRDISKGASVGFGPAHESKGSYDRMKPTVQQELKQHFRPEFLNRVDDTIVFHMLSREEILTIVDLMIAASYRDLALAGVRTEECRCRKPGDGLRSGVAVAQTILQAHGPTRGPLQEVTGERKIAADLGGSGAAVSCARAARNRRFCSGIPLCPAAAHL